VNSELKAEAALVAGYVKLVGAEGGFLSFIIQDFKRPSKKHEVWRDNKGVWHCNATTSRNIKDKTLIHCQTFNKGNCYHVKMCKKWLKGESI